MGNPVAFGDRHRAFPQSPMPSESEPVYVEPVPEPQMDSSKVCLQKIKEMGVELVSDPSTYVKKRTQRQDDSILKRHMDDVVGTGQEEHHMSDFEHMKISLYWTEVVVLRNEGHTVNFWGPGITMTSSGLEVREKDGARGIR